MPRPPRRTVAARRGEQKKAGAAKLVHVDSPAPSSVVPSSPPILRQVQPTALATSTSLLSTTSDPDIVPSTLPLGDSTNDNIPATVSRVSQNTIARASEAASTISRHAVANIEVSKTPSPSAPVRALNVLSTCTPSPVEMRGRKRDSKTAFEEDFAASLMAAEGDDDSDSNDMAPPDTPTRSGGSRRKRQSLDRPSTVILDDEHPVLNLMGRVTGDMGKRVGNPDDTIDFNYSSSPERSPAPRMFGLLKPLENSESEDSDPESEEEEHDENQMEHDRGEQGKPAPLRPQRRKAAVAAPAIEKPKPIDTKHPTTKSLQSLLPKRRAKPKPTESKAKAKPTKEKTMPLARSRAALGDVTKDILDEDELQAIDAPPRPLFGAGMDILSDDELGQEIYVDSSARSSSVGAPPTPASPPPAQLLRRTARGAKGKGRAASAEPETAGRQPLRRRTYGKPRRQDSEVSNKENDTPAPARAGGRMLAMRSSKLAEAAGVELNKSERATVEQIRNKFREVDRWNLCFEDVTPTSSDGVVAGAR